MLSDLDFGVRFAKRAGDEIVRLRMTTKRRKKLDRTDVTDADEDINCRFIQAVKRREPKASVQGEERSLVRGNAKVWTIDPIDGTGEYVDDSIPDSLRTTCVAISLLLAGRLVLSVVNNPFRRELFIATAHGPVLLNGQPIRCSEHQLARGAPYDYAHWQDALFDLPRLEARLGKPLGVYSAIYQACMVAAGRSVFAAFAGATIHDIAPGALLVAQAGGLVTDFQGRSLSWSSLRSGVLYANRLGHQQAIMALRSL